MNCSKLLLLSLVVTLCAVGCSNAEEVRSVAWYKAPENKTAFEEKLGWCRQHKEKQGVDQNCINAETAFATMGSFEKVKEPKVPTFGVKP